MENLSEEELQETTPEDAEIESVNENWHYRVLEFPEGDFVWQCMICGDIGEERKDEKRNASTGGLGHAKSHGIDKKRKKAAVVEEVEEDELKNEYAEPGKWRPFEQVKSPTKCLREILDEYQDYFKAGFMQLMVKRSKRMEGMHPQEFVDNIISMNSGISNNKEARLIGEEYRDALENEREKAQELDVSSVHFPLESYDDQPSGSGERVSMGTGGGAKSAGRDNRKVGYDKNRRGKQEPQGGQQGGEDMQTELMKELVSSKDKQIDRLAKMKEEKQELEKEVEKEKKDKEISRLESQIERLGDKFEKTVDKLAEESSSDDEGKLTKEDMKMMLEKRDAEHRADEMEGKMDRVMDKLDKYEERLNETQEEKEKLQRQLLEEKEKSKSSPGDFDSDEYKMLSSMGGKAIDLGKDWVTESKKNRRLVIRSLLKEGKISKDEAEEMLEEDTESTGEVEVLEDYLDEEDVEEE